MKATVIAVVGGKKSGKTTTIEALTRGLAKRGFRVAAVKHIPEPDFTIDTEGKDTWRYAQAGARTIIGISPDEVATMEKITIKSYPFGSILKKCGKVDVIFLEGFRKEVGNKRNIFKIVITRSAEEASEALKVFKPILAFTGPYSTKSMHSDIPYVDTSRNVDEIIDIIEKIARKKKT
ncbi:molybdopterin-guanine dinucleotide biosynthesis protein B [Candidatus Bathyarchaeota archaeon]|nr:molybdopterin-guanine dinucleotide biosynthesis protein B [Candidatus Bathyarchaeota archaeon]